MSWDWPALPGSGRSEGAGWLPWTSAGHVQRGPVCAPQLKGAGGTPDSSEARKQSGTSRHEALSQVRGARGVRAPALGCLWGGCAHETAVLPGVGGRRCGAPQQCSQGQLSAPRALPLPHLVPVPGGLTPDGRGGRSRLGDWRGRQLHPAVSRPWALWLRSRVELCYFSGLAF